MRRSPLILIFVCLCALPAAAWAGSTVYEWYVSPTGGRFAPARVLLLLGRKATNEGIRDAIFSWLKHPIEEDLVFIFFAGHGFRLPLKI